MITTGLHSPEQPTRDEIEKWKKAVRAMTGWQIGNIEIGRSLNSGSASIARKPGHWKDWQVDIAMSEIKTREKATPSI
ncbi:MAG: hypothetical protein OD918_01795 [Gammaproteobacteria bacterium]